MTAALAALLGGCGQAGSHRRAHGPSVVLLVIDTLRADHLGVYGNRPSPSPNIDALASKGVLFTNAFAQCSWTRPSFASFLTGMVPRATGIQRELGDALDPRFTTLAEALKAAGYTTFGATANPNINTVFGFDQGFDRYLDSKVVFAWMTVQRGQKPAGQLPIQSADEVLGSLLDLVANGGAGPYYLQADLMEVHEYHGLEDPARSMASLPASERLRRYDLAIKKVDGAIQRFLVRLRSIEGFEDALVLLTADHGEGLADHPHVKGAIGHGSVVYGSQAHVPLLLVDGPGPLPEGVFVEAPVRLMDLFPTVLDAVGQQVPAGLDGRSLSALIRKREDPRQHPRPVVVETHFRGANKIAWYDPDWRLVENRDGHLGTAPVELFDSSIKEDGAANSVAAGNPGKVRSLAAKLAAWERLNPSGERWKPKGGIPDDVQKQLERLGY